MNMFYKGFILFAAMVALLQSNSMSYASSPTPRYTYGYINKTGKIVIKPELEAAFCFSNGLAPAGVYNGKEMKYGYLNKGGNFVIQPQFEDAQKFSENLAAVDIGNKCGFIDNKGKLVIEPKYDAQYEVKSYFRLPNNEPDENPAIHFSIFSEGLAPVAVGDPSGLFGYIDKTGKFVIQPKFIAAHSFSQGLAAVRMGKKWGYINKLGNVVINPQFQAAGDFSENLAPVRIPGDVHFIHPFTHTEAYTDGSWGFIDKTGKVIIAPKFDGANAFSEGLACVRIIDPKEGYVVGYINCKGEMVISPRFGSGRSFSSGLAAVRVFTKEWGIIPNQKWGYIDKTGQIKIKPTFETVGDFSDELAIFGVFSMKLTGTMH